MSFQLSEEEMKVIQGARSEKEKTREEDELKELLRKFAVKKEFAAKGPFGEVVKPVVRDLIEKLVCKLGQQSNTIGRALEPLRKVKEAHDAEAERLKTASQWELLKAWGAAPPQYPSVTGLQLLQYSEELDDLNATISELLVDTMREFDLVSPAAADLNQQTAGKRQKRKAGFYPPVLDDVEQVGPSGGCQCRTGETCSRRCPCARKGKACTATCRCSSDFENPAACWNPCGRVGAEANPPADE